QSMARRVESGGVLSFSGVSEAAQPFIAALLHSLFPGRMIVVVTDGLKSQEGFHQDLTTWLHFQTDVQSPDSKVANGEKSGIKSHGPGENQGSERMQSRLFYTVWDILPNEDRTRREEVC